MRWLQEYSSPEGSPVLVNAGGEAEKEQGERSRDTDDQDSASVSGWSEGGDGPSVPSTPTAAERRAAAGRPSVPMWARAVAFFILAVGICLHYKSAPPPPEPTWNGSMALGVDLGTTYTVMAFHPDALHKVGIVGANEGYNDDGIGEGLIPPVFPLTPPPAPLSVSLCMRTDR